MRSLRKHEFELGFWTLADQGAVSLGNFLTQVILARNLTRIEYGVFALLFGVLIVLYTCHLSLVSYPLTVKGASADRAGLQCLASSSLLLTCALSVPLAAILLGASLILRRPSLVPWLVAALLFWLLQETTRRGLLAHLCHRAAV